MTNCPSEETISEIASGGIGGQQRDKVLKHILGCELCGAVAERFEQIKMILSCARIQDDGELVLETPQPGEGFKRSLRRKVVAEFDKNMSRKSRLRSLLEEAVEDIFGMKFESPQEPALGGYFATRPEEEKDGPPREQAELLDRLYRTLTLLLEALLDPEVDLEQRLSRADHLLQIVLETREISDSQDALQ